MDKKNVLSEIFCGEMSGIIIQNNDSVKKVDQQRDLLLCADQSYLADKNINIDILSITSLPNGRFRTRYKNVDLEMLFHYKKGMPLYVVLNGAKTSIYPEFKRWSWYPFIQGSMLNIADPMYAKHPDLKIGWYYGDAETDYRLLVADVVLKIAEFLKIDRKDIVVYGSSGGGAAGIEVASLIGGGCTCIVINPQIYLENSDLYPSFVKVTGLEPKEDVGSKRNDPIHWLKGDCKFIFVENIASPLDCHDILCLGNRMGFPIEYGLTKFNNLIVWAYEARSDQPHSAQEDFTVHFQITFLKNLFESEEVFNEYKKLYLLFGEDWGKMWKVITLRERMEKEIRVLESEFETVLEKKDISISAKPIKYNAYELETKIYALSEYCLEMRGVEVNQKSEGKFSVAIRDKKRNRLIYLVQNDCSDDTCTLTFSTGRKTDNLEIKIYAGIAGDTENKSMKIGRLKLSKRRTISC